MKKTLVELKEQDIKYYKNRPAISVFRDKMSLGAILEKAYITPKYHLKKYNKDCNGIDEIINRYHNDNLIFVADGGAGKTSAFLRLYLETGYSFDGLKFFYFFVPNYYGININNYNKKIRKCINDGTGIDGILLLDGLEEAFAQNSKLASDLLIKLDEAQITFWASCRTSFFERLDYSVIPVFSDIVTIKSWDTTDFDCFVQKCLKDNDEKDVILERINSIKQNGITLLERPLFATMILFVAEEPESTDIYNEYELIDLFLKKWIENEEKEKKLSVENNKCFETLREIALSVYLNNDMARQYNKDLSAFHDLLVFSSKKSDYVKGFVHREFLIYFIVNALIDSASENTDNILKWFSQTFYDDITNVMKPVLFSLKAEQSSIIYNNLFTKYKYTYEHHDEIKKDFRTLNLPEEASFLRLRDEIIYFTLLLPHVDSKEFVEYAYKNSKDVMLFLGIAYGMARKEPSNSYTLEFAKKLYPGTPEEIRNRGWGMCFFGDVEGKNGYEYKDDEGKPWNKIRDNRLKRLKDNVKKYVTRVLDIPLLYCFYASREFRDCNSFADYSIICTTNISLSAFHLEQKEFLREQKGLLQTTYLQYLLRRELLNNTSNLCKIQKGINVNMCETSNEVSINIEKEVAELLLRQIEHRESICRNIKKFWDEKGDYIINRFQEKLSIPEHENISNATFEEKIKKCKALIMSANRVEGTIITRRLIEANGGSKLDAYATGGHLFQFASINGIPILHIWPTGISSFTKFGSFSAVNNALRFFLPKYVFAVGVAFGIDPNNQTLGDVLISKKIVFYDNYNKVTDNTTKISPEETYTVDPNLIAQLHQLEIENVPEDVGEFKWYFDTILSGGSVLSDVNEKEKLITASSNIGCDVVGGEMEANGIYYACQVMPEKKIPFMIFKGICDWGAEKNSWKSVLSDKYDNDTVKDCVQAYACDNAFNAMAYCLSHLSME